MARPVDMERQVEDYVLDFFGSSNEQDPLYILLQREQDELDELDSNIIYFGNSTQS